MFFVAVGMNWLGYFGDGLIGRVLSLGDGCFRLLHFKGGTIFGFGRCIKSLRERSIKILHHIPHTKAQVLSRRVWDILTLLPTSPTLLDGFQKLDCESKLQHLLDPASPQKLMYSLYIVESLNRNSNLHKKTLDDIIAFNSPLISEFIGSDLTDPSKTKGVSIYGLVTKHTYNSKPGLKDYDSAFENVTSGFKQRETFHGNTSPQNCSSYTREQQLKSGSLCIMNILFRFLEEDSLTVFVKNMEECLVSQIEETTSSQLQIYTLNGYDLQTALHLPSMTAKKKIGPTIFRWDS
ncbi:Ubiquitin carboxyl-terminal hydrolase 34 [Homalodisca vitripennis]|nr:Ubiquitin carboxyl-terminal hydrolase 34 [Homalodisca vitripennis]